MPTVYVDTEKEQPHNIVLQTQRGENRPQFKENNDTATSQLSTGNTNGNAQEVSQHSSL